MSRFRYFQFQLVPKLASDFWEFEHKAAQIPAAPSAIACIDSQPGSGRERLQLVLEIEIKQRIWHQSVIKTRTPS